MGMDMLGKERLFCSPHATLNTRHERGRGTGESERNALNRLLPPKRILSKSDKCHTQGGALLSVF